jgi:hypothetical protein
MPIYRLKLNACLKRFQKNCKLHEVVFVIVLDIKLSSNNNPLERIGDAIGDFGSAAGNIVIPLGYLFQIILVMMIIRSLMRDDKFERIGWWRALGYALIFTAATPLLGVILGALSVWLFPYAWQILDPMALLSKLSEVDASAAGTSRPWAYVLALVCTIIFFLWKRHVLHKRGLRFGLLNWISVFAFALVANLLSQFLLYGIFQTFSAPDKDQAIDLGKSGHDPRGGTGFVPDLPERAEAGLVPDEIGRERRIHEYFAEYGWNHDSILINSPEKALVDLWLLQLSRFHYNHAKVDADDSTWQTVGFTWRTQTGVCRDSAVLLADLLAYQGMDARLALGETKGPNWSNDGSKHAWVVVRDAETGKEYLLESTLSTTDFKMRTPPLASLATDYFAEAQVTKDSYSFNKTTEWTPDYTNGWDVHKIP